MNRLLLLSRFWFLIALLYSLTNINPVYSAEYYVDDKSGNDSNIGDSTAPWKTINHAIIQASGSDSIYVGSGTYNESISFAAVAKRSINLIGKVNGDEIPVISSSNPDVHTITLVNHKGTIEGLGITGANNANGINCTSKENDANTAQIKNCKIYGNNVGIHSTTESDSGTCSPYIYMNQIYSNSTRGIGNMSNSSAIIDGNYIYNNGAGIEDNSGVGNSENSAPVIINNVIYENDVNGIAVSDSSNPRIINNTIVNNAQSDLSAAISVSQNEGISSLEIVNNIITDNKYGIVSQSTIPCSGNNYNDVWDNSANDYVGFEKGINDISKDPLFKDINNNDYRLTPDSPCIDSGKSENLVKTDIKGTLRPQGDGYDMGAYEKTPPFLPKITTTAVSSITTTSASSGGNVTSDGGASVTARGICWSTSANPTISNSKTTDGTGTGSFTSSITGLSSGTTYHVRAYATNTDGTGYGNEVTFKTLYAPTIYVNTDGTCGGKSPCYTSIQEAINVARSGVAIRIAQGTYSEPITLNTSKSLTLQGGWNDTYTSQTSNTTFIKAPKATQGSVTLQMVTIKP